MRALDRVSSSPKLTLHVKPLRAGYETSAVFMISFFQRQRFVFARSMISSVRPFMTAFTM